MAYDVGRRPGAWVLRKAARRERWIWVGFGTFVLIAAVMFVLAVDRRLTVGASLGFLAVVLAVRYYADRYVDRTLLWYRGARAEQAVGETLDELRREGWIVMHDIEIAGEGNIDHLASGPNGVYLIETKERRYLDSHLGRTKRHAAWLHDELGVWVTPVICLHRREGEAFRSRGVWVIPRERLLDWLRKQSNAPVEFERLARFAQRIEG